jgi:hypothetical protein
MHDRAVAHELGIQLVGQSIAAEFHIKIPQHFGLGLGEGTIRGVRNRPQKIPGQSEQRLEGAQESVPVTVVEPPRR